MHCCVQPDGLVDVLITVDQGVEHQQNLAGLRIAIVILAAPSNDIDDLRPLLPALRRALDDIGQGSIVRVSI